MPGELGFGQSLVEDFEIRLIAIEDKGFDQEATVEIGNLPANGVKLLIMPGHGEGALRPAHHALQASGPVRFGNEGDGGIKSSIALGDRSLNRHITTEIEVVGYVAEPILFEEQTVAPRPSIDRFRWAIEGRR